MNKVFILLRAIPYEGDDILGVYDSEDLALAEAKKLTSKPRAYADYYDYRVEERAVICE